jgi:hypothetical protein
MKRTGFFLAIKFIALLLYYSSRPAWCADKITEISGVVFEDLNHNGIQDMGEKGITGILVSNQSDISSTDETGRYSLPLGADESVIYVIKPAAYEVPLDENKLPQFYYIHKPQGSKNLYYGGIEPTGDLPGNLNFPLIPILPSDTFHVAVLADPQTRTLEEVHYLRDDIVAELPGTGALFGIALGDIMFDDLSLFNEYDRTMAMAGFPVFHVPGNHDFDHHPDSVHNTPDTYIKHLGPDYYAFEYGQVSFIMLNTVDWMEEQSNKYYRNYRGSVPENQLHWISNYLDFIDEDRLIVFCMHIPLYTMDSLVQQNHIDNLNQLMELVKGRKHLLAISGHMHALENFYLDATLGWNAPEPFQVITCATAAGGWWHGPRDERGIPASLQMNDGTPNGYHIFRFTGNTYQQRFKAAGKDENYQLRISAPHGIIHRDETDSVLVAVNFFNGNDLAELTYTLNDSISGSMQRTPMKDPFAERYYSKNKSYFEPWMSVGVSSHMWAAYLPENLSAGMHKLGVVAKDEYGNEYQQTAIFEIK